MPLMLSKTCDALREAGASEELAREAAEEIATSDARPASVESKLNILQWMVGTNVILTTGVLLRLLFLGTD